MKFTLEIELGNDAMHTGYDIAVALEKVAKRVNGNHTLTSEHTRVRGISDANGNFVGSWKIEE